MSKIWIRVGAINKTYKASIHPLLLDNEIKVDLKSEHSTKTIGQVNIIFDKYDLKRLKREANDE